MNPRTTCTRPAERFSRHFRGASTLTRPDRELLNRIPLAARTVLQIGCGDGALAAAYRPMNPTVQWMGIEPDPAAAALARAHVDQLSTVDPEAEPLPFDLPPEGLDCIIYDEVLEYLRDPWTLVHRHVEALAVTGTMLLRTRNSGHWQLVRGLLQGEALPADGPIGFDGDTVLQRLRKAGLFLCDVAASPDDTDGAEEFVTAITPGLHALGIEPDAYRGRCRGAHLTWRVRRQPFVRLIVSGSMLDPVGGVSHVRVLHPLQAMATDPTVSAGIVRRVGADPGDGVPRIFVLHRPALLGEQGRRTLATLQDAGYLIVTEFDDLPDHFEMMRHGGELNFTGVHAVQTSTPALAEVLRGFNEEVAVFPNVLAALPTSRNFTDPERKTFFFGALNREADWAPLMPAINYVARLAGERLRFQVVHDSGFYAALDTPYKAFQPTCDYETYQHLLGAAEIAFMPLGDTPFNRAKSDLKFIEAAAFRVAALASDVVYADTIRDNETGLLFRDPEECRIALMRLVGTPDLARTVAEAARTYVSGERMMAYQVADRIAWYRSLWERREILEQKRRSRMALTPA